MDNKLYEKYAVLDSQIKDLLKRKDELKSEILQDMVDTDAKAIDSAFGRFTVANLKTWTYTGKVEKLEEEYKNLKATEQSTGDATFEEKPSLRFVQYKL